MVFFVTLSAAALGCKGGDKNAEKVKEAVSAPAPSSDEANGEESFLAKKLEADSETARNDKAAANDGWVAYSSVEGKYRARFPSKPATETTPTPTDVGNVDLITTSIASDDGFLATSYADYPPELVKEDIAHKLLDGARDGMTRNMGGKVIREEEIELDGHKGRSFDMTATTQGMSIIASARLYLVGNRLYQNLVLRPASIGIDDEAKKFLDSFAFGAE